MRFNPKRWRHQPGKLLPKACETSHWRKLQSVAGVIQQLLASSRTSSHPPCPPHPTSSLKITQTSFSSTRKDTRLQVAIANSSVDGPHIYVTALKSLKTHAFQKQDSKHTHTHTHTQSCGCNLCQKPNLAKESFVMVPNTHKASSLARRLRANHHCRACSPLYLAPVM